MQLKGVESLFNMQKLQRLFCLHGIDVASLHCTIGTVR